LFAITELLNIDISVPANTNDVDGLALSQEGKPNYFVKLEIYAHRERAAIEL